MLLKRTFNLFAILAVVTVSFSSCYYDNEEELYQNVNDCDTTAVSFNDDIFPLIEGNCVSGCHEAGGSGAGVAIFENYLSVKEKVDNGTLNNRVVIQQTMPPNTDLTDCQITQVQAWILNGAPNN